MAESNNCVCGHALHPETTCAGGECGCSLSEMDDGEFGVQIPWQTPSTRMIHAIAQAAIMRRG